MTPQDRQKAYQQVMNGEAVLLDVRAEWERDEDGFEPKSIHMDYELFTEGKLPDLPKDTIIYLHCKSGGRSGIVAHVLKSHGFKHVSNLGGFDDWTALKKG